MLLLPSSFLPVDLERCHPTQPFRCPGDKTICISIQYLCDGASDCPDGYDEDLRLCTAGPRWLNGKVLASKPESSRPSPLKIRRVLGLLHVKSYVGVKRPPSGVVGKFGEGVPDQVSSSSSDLTPP
ncbi:hypothetical protein AVEN_9045-1 [Araneus ventricosus]|uniref:Uncharacterized protein n=1 Tax=Araneus ventricosus TaxID=182803 RepID=A0A4Y2NIP4_ARAVE|nr:hypothetical protein AVEN_9045-1 [Araneus ventricosus]